METSGADMLMFRRLSMVWALVAGGFCVYGLHSHERIDLSLTLKTLQHPARLGESARNGNPRKVDLPGPGRPNPQIGRGRIELERGEEAMYSEML